jgi:hypothetical protein
VGVGGRCNKKRDDPAWIAPFGSSLTSRRASSSLGCVYAYTLRTPRPTLSGFRARGSMVGLFSLSCFARHVSARCIPRREADSLEEL